MKMLSPIVVAASLLVTLTVARTACANEVFAWGTQVCKGGQMILDVTNASEELDTPVTTGDKNLLPTIHHDLAVAAAYRSGVLTLDTDTTGKDCPAYTCHEPAMTSDGVAAFRARVTGLASTMKSTGIYVHTDVSGALVAAGDWAAGGVAEAAVEASVRLVDSRGTQRLLLTDRRSIGAFHGVFSQGGGIFGLPSYYEVVGTVCAKWDTVTYKHADFDNSASHVVALPVKNGETAPFVLQATLLSEAAAAVSEKGAVAVSKLNDHHDTPGNPGVAGGTPTEGLTVSLSAPHGAQIEVYSVLDCNMDGQVDVLDAQIASNQAQGIATSAPMCDANLDGAVDVLDVQAVVNCMLGYTCG